MAFSPFFIRPSDCERVPLVYTEKKYFGCICDHNIVFLILVALRFTFGFVVFPLSAALDSMGANIEVAKYTERLVPSTRIVSVDGVAPVLPGANNFIAPSASVIGNVTIGEHSR